jgi:hypothetical protein
LTQDNSTSTAEAEVQVYVGFFSHGAYRSKDDRSRTTIFNAGRHFPNAKKLLMDEYRYFPISSERRSSV